MKALIQRVIAADVAVDDAVIGRIGVGFLVLLGVRTGDADTDASALARRTAALRIFPDAEGRMNRSLRDVGGEALVVSQFTLYADTRKGNRPSFIRAGDPGAAQRLYEGYVACLATQLGAAKVRTGRFGAHMRVSLINDGPVTIELNTDVCADA